MMNKKHFRRLLACVALCLFAVLAKAENYSFTLVINGESYVFNLAEKPVITYEGDKLNVKVTEPSTVVEEQSTVREISVPVVEIQNIDLEKVNVVDEDGAGVKDATTKTSFADGQLQVSGLEPGSQVAVVGLDGGGRLTLKATADGTAIINLHSLPAGVYIVRTAHSSVKVINK
jgi:hypothetical protein